MDYVYVCRDGENPELKYSLRSIEKNIKVDNVWLIGNKPSWFSGNFVKVRNIGNKFQNIQNCISVLCDVHDISEDFVLMNDDFYVLNPVDALKQYHGGSLKQKISNYVESNSVNRYSKLLSEAARKLGRLGIEDPLDYDIHVPMPMNRFAMKEVINLSLAPRSFYGNYFNVGGDLVEDVKVRHDNYVESDSFLSSEDSFFFRVEKRLQDLFPEPSQYEKI